MWFQVYFGLWRLVLKTASAFIKIVIDTCSTIKDINNFWSFIELIHLLNGCNFAKVVLTKCGKQMSLLTLVFSSFFIHSGLLDYIFKYSFLNITYYYPFYLEARPVNCSLFDTGFERGYNNMTMHRSRFRGSKHKLYVGFYVACWTRRLLGNWLLTGLIQKKIYIYIHIKIKMKQMWTAFEGSCWYSRTCIQLCVV